ncbi:WASH complex subunit 3 [Erpetoichthys calabaricus]|uniref:WASH complex subunit 3 n=1 Tax=Erpetoichthys calabaricus TaxID=27687 RepID=A0A8C4RW03_ERPCA|nr:WASH complex subunit 3 [Erpetoichthys calabaricus]
MDEDGLPIVGSGIDLTKVPAIQQKRIVAFLNQFIVHTVQFLNRFSSVCEEKLSSISLRIQQIETTLNILEAKLSSIPGLEDVKIESINQRSSLETNGHVSVADQTNMSTDTTEPHQNTGRVNDQSKANPTTENALTVAKDPRYARYLKMVQVGVPVMAIRNKMIAEGLDPALLENPEAPVPDGGIQQTQEESDNSGSESSFSD